MRPCDGANHARRRAVSVLPEGAPSMGDSLWANLWIGALLLAAVAPYAVGALTAAMQRRIAQRTRDLLASAGIEPEPDNDRPDATQLADGDGRRA